MKFPLTHKGEPGKVRFVIIHNIVKLFKTNFIPLQGLGV